MDILCLSDNYRSLSHPQNENPFNKQYCSGQEALYKLKEVAKFPELFYLIEFRASTRDLATKLVHHIK